MLTKEIILCDADGCLLNWIDPFNEWMSLHGWEQNPNASHYYNITDIYNGIDVDSAKKFTRLFNESANIGFLPAFRDSKYYVRRLHEEFGFVFRIITSLSLNSYAGKLREQNLTNLFGSAIESVICLDTGADKYQALLPYQYSNLFWIEDKVENADAGYNLGLSPILIEHDYNKHHAVNYPCVKNWKEIYRIISGKLC